MESERSNTERKVIMRNKNLCFIRLATAAMVAIVLLLTGSHIATAADQPSMANSEIKIDNFTFGPQTVTVPVGATVTWTNKDDIPHTSVSTDGVFKSKVLDTEEKFSYTFSKAGSYPYYCTIHPKMTGTIVVK